MSVSILFKAGISALNPSGQIMRDYIVKREKAKNLIAKRDIGFSGVLRPPLFPPHKIFLYSDIRISLGQVLPSFH